MSLALLLTQPLRMPHRLLEPECDVSYRSVRKTQGRGSMCNFSKISNLYMGVVIFLSFQVFQVTDLQPGKFTLSSGNYSSVVYFRVIYATYPAGRQSASFYYLSKYSLLMTRIIVNPQTAYYTASGHLNIELCYKAVVLTVV